MRLSTRPAQRRPMVIAILAAAVSAGVAPAAGAATLAVDGSGSLVYASAVAADRFVSFSQSGAGTVVVTRLTVGSFADGDPVVSGGGCSASAADVLGEPRYTCTGVARVSASAAAASEGTSSLFAGPVENTVGPDTVTLTGLTNLPATLTGGVEDDELTGGGTDDVLDGGGGDDTLVGNAFNDRLMGGTGDDVLLPGGGKDTVDGGVGEDFVALEPDVEPDDISGGSGIDGVLYFTGAQFGPSVSVNLDELANDGQGGELDRVRPDIEDVSVQTSGIPASGQTLIGSAAANVLSGGEGNDEITGGAGNDDLSGNGGDDIVHARDGYADRVTCGPGYDRVIVDQLDVVGTSCEGVETATVPNATEDLPPLLSLFNLLDGQLLPSATPTALSVTATDDRGISQVQFFSGGRTLCFDTTSPYACAYLPNVEDVGRNTLYVVATDTGGQTTTALHTVKVARFAPAGLTAKTTPRRDAKAPFVFTTSGKLGVPARIANAQPCSGVVTVALRAGKKTVASADAPLRASCSFRARFSLAKRPSASKLQVSAKFAGNSVLDPIAARSTTVKVR